MWDVIFNIKTLIIAVHVNGVTSLIIISLFPKLIRFTDKNKILIVILMFIFRAFLNKMDTINLFYVDQREKTSRGS